MHTTSYATDPPAPERAALPQPGWLAEAAADVQHLYVYWAARRAGRLLPRRHDIDFTDLAEAFPGMLLAEKLPPKAPGAATAYIYRPVDLGGQDLDPHHARGFGWAGLDPALFQHIPADGCDRAAKTRTPLTEHVGFISGDGVVIDYEVVFLPLAGATADTVDGILILAVEVPSDTGAN